MSKRSSISTSSSSSEISFIPEIPPSSASLLSKKEQKILDNARELAWLERQIAEMDKELNPRIPEQPYPEMITMDDLYGYRREIDEKRSELLKVSNYSAQKEQILDNVQRQIFMEEALYPLASDSMDQLQNKRQIQDTLTKIDNLSKELMKEHAQLSKDKRRLLDIRKEIDQVEQSNRELFQAHMRTLKEPPADKTEIIALLEREGQLQEQTEMVRRVLVGLVVESRVDWADDPELRDLMLKIGDDFDVVARKKQLRELKEGVANMDDINGEESISDAQSMMTSDSLSMDPIVI